MQGPEPRVIDLYTTGLQGNFNVETPVLNLTIGRWYTGLAGLIMRYWMADQDSFIERVGLAPDMRVLDLVTDGHLCSALSGRVEEGVVAVGPIGRLRGAMVQAPGVELVACEPDILPFRDCSFHVVFSYHGLESYEPSRLDNVLSEVFRVLRPGGVVALLIRSSTPFTPAQEADLDLVRALESKSLLFLHDYGEVTRALGVAGFDDITMEIVRRDVPVPMEWRKAHALTLRSLGHHGIAGAEALLPAIQFRACRVD